MTTVHWYECIIHDKQENFAIRIIFLDFLYLNASPTTTTKQLINLDRDQEKAWNEPV